MSLNYLSYATLPVPRMGREFLLSQNDQSIYRYFSLQKGESMNVLNTGITSYLYAFLGSFSATGDGNEKTVEAGDIFKLAGDMQSVEIRAESNTMVYHLDDHGLDKLVAWTEISRQMSANNDAAKRLNMLMNFSKLELLPVETMFELSMRMTEVEAEAGDEIVKQGDCGDSFFVMESGTAEVWQIGVYDEEPQMVATLGTGDSFGEDSLVTGCTRNATIRMTSGGKLFRGDKSDFQELIMSSSIKEILPETVPDLLKQGHELVDVRYEEEFEDEYIDGAKLVPLNVLRERLGEFKKGVPYVVYCRSGKRSAVATMVMTRAGLNATSMVGGILGWPFQKSSAY